MTLGRDVSQLSDDQLRNLVAELDRRFRNEALTSAAQAATTEHLMCGALIRRSVINASVNPLTANFAAE
jgi:hypothetical protein